MKRLLAIVLLLVLVPTAPAAGGQEAATGVAAISGVVVDGATKRPMAGVAVSLDVERPVVTQLRPPPSAQTLTDDKGRFVFWPLQPGTGYRVNASAPGYFDGGYGRRTSTRSGRRIALADRQWFEHADIEMWRPGAISGRVIDEHGDPVVGVMVRVMAQIHVAGRAQVASGPNVLTDDRGVYRIAGLAPGRYYVVVPSTQMAAPTSAIAPIAASLAGASPSALSPPTAADPSLEVDPRHRLFVGRFPTPPWAPDGRLMAYPVTWYPGTTTVNAAMLVDLHHGLDRSGVDIQLRPVHAFRVSGVVQGPGDVVSKMTLRLLPAGSEALGLGSEAATALVGPDGSFTFLNVPSGEYTLDGRGTITEYEFNADFARYMLPLPPGATSTTGSAMSLSSGTPGAGMTTIGFSAGDRQWARMPVVVGDRDVANLVVTLQPTVTLRGRLVYEGTAKLPEVQSFGVARPGVKPPAMRPFIIAEPATGDASLGQPRNSIWSDDTSEFLIEGLMPGEYFLRLSRSPQWTVKSIVAASRDYTNTPFDAAGARDFTDITVTLTDRVTTVGGTVTAADGRPAASATVIAFPAERGQWRNYGLSPDRIRTTLLSNIGSYQIQGLPAGDYLLVAVDEPTAETWHDPAFFEAAAAAATRVSVEWGASVVQNLRVAEVRLR